MILTPDQRVRVFISSTLEELAEEHAAALRAIRRLHLVPVWYESGARPHPPQSMYRAYLEQSQIFVGIYWQRYGWVGPGMEISGLEDEFRLAAGKPMLLYLKQPAPNREPGLTAMIDGIRSAGEVSYRHFATAKELERLLTDDLAVLLSESFAGATISSGASRPSPTGPGEPDGAELPTGTVTFLFTDIEGSTQLLRGTGGLRRLRSPSTGVCCGRHSQPTAAARSTRRATPSSWRSRPRARRWPPRPRRSGPWPPTPGRTGCASRAHGAAHRRSHPRRAAATSASPCTDAARIAAAASGGQVLVSDADRRADR